MTDRPETLREKVERLPPGDWPLYPSSQARAGWRVGFQAGIDAVLALIPEGAALVTEEGLAWALNGGSDDGLDYKDEWYSSPNDLAAAILARLQESV